MDDFGEKILSYYIIGFRDELIGTTTIVPDDELLALSYKLGSADALNGGDISSVDTNPPNFTPIWDKATELHRNGKISQIQIHKIYRTLSVLRNENKIRL